MIVKQKSAGRDLSRAYDQAGEYFDALPEHLRPGYILVSHFQTFELHDLADCKRAAFALSDLHAHVEKFGFILGVQRRAFKDQDPASINPSLTGVFKVCYFSMSCKAYFSRVALHSGLL